MTFPRFHCPIPLAIGARADLPENAARHAGRVLRLKEGDGIVLFDGHGGEYEAHIAEVAKARVAVDVVSWRDVGCESPLDITLVQALQSGDKMDMTIQKAVELGATRIAPVTSRRSVLRLDGERAQRRVEHWRGVAVAACEQCGRNRVPGIDDLASLDRWLSTPIRPGDGEVLRLMMAPGSAQTLAALEPPRGRRIELLIGAEGGLAPEEVDRALQAGFVAIRLGPRVLRTETAGLAALSAMQCLWGDFGEEAHHV